MTISNYHMRLEEGRNALRLMQHNLEVVEKDIAKRREEIQLATEALKTFILDHQPKMGDIVKSRSGNYYLLVEGPNSRIDGMWLKGKNTFRKPGQILPNIMLDSMTVQDVKDKY